MEIYADILFFINFISSYIMLDLTGRITHRRAMIKRLLISAALGGFLAIISFCSVDLGVLIKIGSAVLMVFICFGYHKGASLRQIIIFMLLSLAMSAVFAVISSINHSQTIQIKNGIMYFNIPLFSFAVIFALSYFTIVLTAFILKRHKQSMIHSIVIKRQDKSAVVTALIDSGNVLKEPLTGKAVIIAEWESAKGLFENINYSEFKDNMEKYKLWIIPYHSLGNRNGLLLAFLADAITIADEKRDVGKMFIGITNERLSKNNEYNALMGSSL